AVRRVAPFFAVREAERVSGMQKDILDKIAAIPGGTSVGFTISLPMEGRFNRDPIIAEDKSYDLTQQTPPIRTYKFVSPGLLGAAGTRLVAGREFTWTEINGHTPIAMVSANLARELWGGPVEALGKRIRGIGPPGAPWREVVGVVEAVYDAGVHLPAPAIVYWPHVMENFYGNPLNVIRSVAYEIRSDRAGSEGLINDIRTAVWSVNP